MKSENLGEEHKTLIWRLDWNSNEIWDSVR